MKIIIYNTTVIALVFLISVLQGHGYDSAYKNILENPLYDVFYMYYNFEREKALAHLASLFDNPEYKTTARINFGVIMENEQNIKSAENYYSAALSRGNKLAFIYLHNLYRKDKPARFIQMIKELETPETNFWPDYESALYYLNYNDTKSAFHYLRGAVKKGFSSTLLLDREPLFDGIRRTSDFQKLYKITQYNSTKRTSILKTLLLKEYIHNQSAPYGMTKDLQMASYLDKNGETKKAREILGALLKSGLSFRDKSMALYWLARLEAKTGNESTAREYLDKFTAHLLSEEKDDTGYKKLVGTVYRDIIKNDVYLNKL